MPDVLARRSQRSTNIWPGFVDALATVLLVLVFLLMVFVLAHFYLGQALSGRDVALRKLQDQVGELADLLALERRASDELRFNVAQLSRELQASVSRRDELAGNLRSMTLRAEEAEKAAEAGKATIEEQATRLANLGNDVAALQALKEELEKKISELAGQVESKGKALVEERNISESARAQIALLNQQMAALREQIARLNQALEASEKESERQQVQIANLGSRLNAALASKVQELSRYRSEFFGRLRDILGAQAGVRIVGDRFVFQSEVLFETASAELGPRGEEQIDQLARTLLDLSKIIPQDIDWILRVDGHTDTVPIRTERFPSNWELSSARAISVVQRLIDQGLPPSRLAAAGFGEYQPIDDREDEIARRRNRRIELKLTER